MSTTARSRSREIHNTTVDEQLALGGRCGLVHLPTGRVCLLPALHVGGCRFESPPPHDNGQST